MFFLYEELYLTYYPSTRKKKGSFVSSIKIRPKLMAKALAQAICTHWEIDNCLHWVLDNPRYIHFYVLPENRINPLRVGCIITRSVFCWVGDFDRKKSSKRDCF